ncbi:type IV pilus assembly protein PilE [Cupriavidus metallidurans]|jgi:type IV pilus assembly protein PilE|uniref:Pilus assembly protein, PilE n=1 Tax=Cupriavidus metallidurans (strain ATCC 43123 / DSM 2839 / NBRC 102507 / CH34) TaxID=266264 RepID=Q1LBD3_CUPMC|nr:type IV pilin protein [Cupriavidus metallidurans]ABF12543.1 pilus assembly protein, PilE [Cupriavidus metallidurans CH34]AVA35251.1 type IV pilin protein [Cupriavidus metallidurans]KWW34414.1 Fimbrial protein [Cupriavidus metallidurans]MDE4921146.1 type IV pilin protein [Cupriavidus metallidurans]QGS32246.1 prepilin-type N-terminal cleavage/methylation domain-containing protein [Cupriavidus metallidurans]
MGQPCPTVRHGHARTRGLFRDIGFTGDGARPRGSSRGFTLIEVMITVAIIGIIAAIAFPSYQRHVVKGNRAAAEAFVLEAASLQERYLVDNRAYATTLSALGFAALPDSIAPNYQVTLTVTAAPPAYVFTATPINTQLARDTDCGVLTLNNTGDKTAAGVASTSCWK